MHGRDQLYTSGYSLEELKSVLNNIRAMKHLKRAYIYFKNDVSGHATRNAESLIKLIGD